jgi:hypothetical protein
LKKAIDPESKEKKRKTGKHDFPARVGEFTEDPANVERNPRGIPSDSASMQDATRKGGLAVIHGSELVGEPDKDNARAFDKLPV